MGVPTKALREQMAITDVALVKVEEAFGKYEEQVEDARKAVLGLKKLLESAEDVPVVDVSEPDETE